MSRRSTLFLIALLTGTVVPLAAQRPGLAPYDEQVLVTARPEGTVGSVPAFVTLIDEAGVAASPALDVPDLLREAGVAVTDVTGAGRSYRVDLRGFGESGGLNTLVLVDGRRVNQPDLSGSDWAQIPLHRVARIEVMRGSGATLFGDNATGGVINIVTRAAGAAETRLGVVVGAYGTLVPTASTRGTAGDVSYSLSAGGRRSDGHRINSQTAGGDVGGDVTMALSPSFELAVSAGYHGDRTGLPGALKDSDLGAGAGRSDSVTPDDFADVDDRHVLVTPRWTLGTGTYVAADVSARHRDARFFSQFSGGEFTGETGLTTLAFSPRVVVEAASARWANRFVAGADLTRAREDIVNTTVFGGVPDEGRFDLSKTGRAVYVRDEIRLGGGTVSAGYRYDHAGYAFEPGPSAGHDVDAHAGEIGATVPVGSATLFAGLARSFRYPVLDELFDFFTNGVHTELIPQRTLEVQAGIRLEAQRAQATLTVFRQVTDDEIYFNPLGGAFGFGANENLDGTSRRTGVELALRALVGPVALGGTLAVIDATIDGGTWDGAAIPGVAGRRATFFARLPVTGAVDVSLNGTHTGPRPFEGDFAGVFGEQDGYTVVDARVQYRTGPVRLFVDLRNLFDAEYSEYGVLGGFPTERARYPSPGMHALVGADLTF